MMERLRSEVLNDTKVLPIIYRSVSTPNLIGELGQSSENILGIGRDNCWMINAQTGHKRHFIGTRSTVGLMSRTSVALTLKKLLTFTLKYATPGASIHVYMWDHATDLFKPIGTCFKSCKSLYQLPGCSLPKSNGILVPVFVKCPIASDKLDQNWLADWDVVRDCIAAAIKEAKATKGYLDQGKTK